jgi:hypothetical protein
MKPIWHSLDSKNNVIDRNNAKENASQKMHIYQMNDKVICKNVMDSKFSENPWKEPRTINHHKSKMTMVQSD